MNLIGLDLDGTLEDSRDDMVAVAQRIRAGLGLAPRPDEALRPHVSRGMPHLYRSCFDDHLGSATDPVATTERIREAYEADYFENIAGTTRLYQGMEACLNELQGLATLVLITNKPERLSRRLLEALGVSSAFAEVMGGDSCAEPKPSPMSLRVAAERCGFERERGTAFMVGDSAGDVRLGHAFGATTIWCAWGYAETPGEIAPDRVARRPGELVGLIRSALEGGT